jgi:hypothetical protein
VLLKSNSKLDFDDIWKVIARCMKQMHIRIGIMKVVAYWKAKNQVSWKFWVTLA